MLGIQNYFIRERFAFKCVGISLERTDSIYYRIYSFCLNVLILIPFPLVQLGDLFKHDFEDVTGIMTYEFALIIVLTQMFIVYFNRQRIRTILDKLQQEPFLENGERCSEARKCLMKECILIVNVQTLTYWIAVVVITVAAPIFALMKRFQKGNFNEWELPYGPLTVLNITYSPNYEITLTYQSFSMFCSACQYSVLDSLLPGILCYMAYQFKMLQHNIHYILSKSDGKRLQGKSSISGELPWCNEVDNDLRLPSWEDLKISLKEIVEFHLAIIEVVNELEDIFNVLLLVKFLNTLGVLCFIVYTTSVIPIDDPRILPLAFEGIIVFFHVFFVCFWGERINHESQQVGVAVYATDFLGIDIKFQKTVILIIRRSQNAVKLSVGKFAPVCLSTFAWVVRTSSSAFLVLRSLNQVDS